jgi:hypothetical protein
MTPNEPTPAGLKAALLEMEQETLRTLEERAAQRTHCLRVPRGRELAFQPSQASAEERAHLADCAYCQRLLEKFRAQDHPALSSLYASQWKQLPVSDLGLVTEHVKTCGRCRLVATAGGLFPGRWIESAFVRFRSALETAILRPAVVGLNFTTSAHAGLNEVIETVDWTVTVVEERGDIRIVVNRRDDGKPHRLATVVIIGLDRPVIQTISLGRAKGWWTGSIQTPSPWANAVEPVDLSVLVAETE